MQAPVLKRRGAAPFITEQDKSLLIEEDPERRAGLQLTRQAGDQPAIAARRTTRHGVSVKGPAHSTLIPASLMSFAYFAVSDFMNVTSCSGVE